MYESYWQLNKKPFEHVFDPAFFFPGEAHHGALLKLRYAIENRRTAALLVGTSGVGKTLLVRQLRQHLSPAFGPMVHLVFPEMSPAELLAYLASGLEGGQTPASHLGLDHNIRALEQALAENLRQGRHAVLVVDESHLLAGTETLEAMRLVTNFEVDGRPAMTLLLVGQPTLLPALDRMPQLEERLSVKSLLRPLTSEETGLYIQHRLGAAGAKREIFDAGAVEAVYQLTHGVPRRINRLCDLTLLIAYAEERTAINGEQVEGVAEELVSVGPE